ncbi:MULTISPECIES: hypothetical protein [Aliagarivorans]|uniref:hypothetical protein n=1 Tax=Aliagarivorans TaxID=882379 RepID=UPI00040467F4|nr:MULTISPECIES: hypothetical protein [Aliagarivorans]
MIERYRMQLDLMSLMKLLFLVGFGVGFLLGLLMALYTLSQGADFFGVLITVIISPFSNGAITAVFGLIGYPFYNWYCMRNRGQLLSGRFQKEQDQA